MRKHTFSSFKLEPTLLHTAYIPQFERNWKWIACAKTFSTEPGAWMAAFVALSAAQAMPAVCLEVAHAKTNPA